MDTTGASWTEGLKGRAPCYGTFLTEVPLQSTVRIAVAAGAQFVIIDGEHGVVELSSLRNAVALCRLAGLAAIVRVPDCRSELIRQALDAGAHGILAANVESVDEARALAERALFPPAGRRGIAFGSAQDDYSAGDIAAKTRQANRDVVLLCMIESPAGTDAAPAIAALPEIAGCWFGYLDFSSYAGIPGEIDHPTVSDAAARVGAACRAAGKAAGVMTTSPAHLEPYLRNHFNAVAWGSDAFVLRHGLTSGLDLCRAAMASRQASTTGESRP